MRIETERVRKRDINLGFLEKLTTKRMDRRGSSGRREGNKIADGYTGGTTEEGIFDAGQWPTLTWERYNISREAEREGTDHNQNQKKVQRATI